MHHQCSSPRNCTYISPQIIGNPPSCLHFFSFSRLSLSNKLLLFISSPMSIFHWNDTGCWIEKPLLSAWAWISFSISILSPNSALLASRHSEQVQKEAGGSKVSSAFLAVFDSKAHYLNNKNIWVTHLIYRPERIECKTFFWSFKEKPKKWIPN